MITGSFEASGDELLMSWSEWLVSAFSVAVFLVAVVFVFDSIGLIPGCISSSLGAGMSVLAGLFAVNQGDGDVDDNDDDDDDDACSSGSEQLPVLA